MKKLKALIFDCDGVIAETERDGHRVSFNSAFEEEGINAEWSISEYNHLVKKAGGKERMKTYFENHKYLLPAQNLNDDYILKLHKRKTEIFMKMSASGELPLRPGIKRVVKEAHDAGILLAVCSTSNEKSVTSLIRALLGEDVLNWFDSIFAGDMVKSKKPAPDIYNLVKEKFKINGNECFVVEDSRNGLLAAKAAGMHCIVTGSFYSREEDFSEADMVVSSLGDPNIAPIEIIQNNLMVIAKPHHISISDLEAMLEGGN